MRKLSLFAILFFHAVLLFGQYTPETVPNNKLINNSYVSNPDGVISETTVADIDAILARVEQQTSSQVAVVVLKSIGDADIFDFAQTLFNKWGIGSTNSNGLLILLVEDIHTVRFHTGYGLEGVLPDAVCKQIQRDHMVPSFKEGNYDAGMLGGVTEVEKILTNPNYAQELVASTTYDNSGAGFEGLISFVLIFLLPLFLICWAYKNSRFSNSKSPSHTDYPQMRIRRSTWLIEFGLIPALIVFAFYFTDSDTAGFGFLALYLYLEATIFHRIIREQRMLKSLKEKSQYYEASEYLRRSSGYWFVMALVFPLPFLLYFPFHFIRKRYYRNHPRKCKLCEGQMKKLSESEEDPFLTKAQLIEEDIKSVNYDVWQCKECKATESWHFKNRLTVYKECPACKAIAWHLVHNKTLKAATYSSDGKGESLHQCKACGKSERKTYTIAQLVYTPPSSSSSSSSSFSSGSSSSGGSWGGGSSGGGGASSSW